MSIIFKEVTSKNFIKCIELKVSKEQQNFVAPNVFSIAQAKVEPDFNPLCAYDGDTMVGFAMYGIDPDNNNMWIARLMVGEDYQRKGYGRAILVNLLQIIKARHNSEKVYLSIEPENEVAEKLYESLGFKNTGKIIEGEVVFCKEL